jgi:hypothetical protein
VSTFQISLNQRPFETQKYFRTNILKCDIDFLRANYTLNIPEPSIVRTFKFFDALKVDSR